MSRANVSEEQLKLFIEHIEALQADIARRKAAAAHQ